MINDVSPPGVAVAARTVFANFQSGRKGALKKITDARLDHYSVINHKPGVQELPKFS